MPEAGRNGYDVGTVVRKTKLALDRFTLFSPVCTLSSTGILKSVLKDPLPHRGGRRNVLVLRNFNNSCNRLFTHCVSNFRNEYS